MTDLNELMRQAQKMQDQFKQAQEGLTNLVVEGQSGAGLVVIKLNGRHDVVSVNIDDSALTEGKEFIEDLIEPPLMTLSGSSKTKRNRR